MTLPTMPAGLTPEWLTTTLTTQGVIPAGVAVTKIERERVGDGVGMMSDIGRLQLTYSEAGAGPSTLVAKFAGDNPTNREVAMQFHLFEREVRYFQELDQQTQLTSPEMLHAEIEGDNFILLMRDLSDYRSGDQAAGCDLHDTELAVDELIKLHGAFWDRMDGLQWVPGVAHSFHADNMHNFSEVGWPVMMQHFGDFVDPSIAAREADFMTARRALQDRMHSAGPKTFIHGDFRLDNFFYGVKPEHHPIVIFDFQGPLQGNGMVDVALMLAQNTWKEVRVEHERGLIERYAAGLREMGIDYSDEQAWQDYLDAVLYNWFYASVVSGTLDVSNPKSFAWISQMVDRQSTASMELDVFSRLDSYL